MNAWKIKLGTSSYYLRLLLSSLFTTMVILIVILIVFDRFFLDYYKDELVGNHRENIDFIGSIIDKELLEMSRTSHQISQDGDLTYFQLTENPYRAFEGVESLKNYNASNILVSQIVLAFFEDEYLISSEGSYRKDLFISVQGLEGSGYEELLNSSAGPGIIETERLLISNYPYPASGLKARGVISFFIEKNNFLRLLNLYKRNRDHYIFLMDSSGSIIISTQDFPEVWRQEIAGALRSGRAELSPLYVNFDGGDFLLQTEKSEVSELKYMSLTSVRTVLAPYRKIQLYIALSIGGLFLVALLINIILSRRNSLPLLKMEKAVDSMKSIIRDKPGAIRNDIINKILDGRISRTPDFIQSMRLAGIDLPFRYFGFVIIQFENPPDPGAILRAVRKTGEKDIRLLYKDSLQKRQIYFFYNSDTGESGLRIPFGELFHHLEEETDEPFTIGIGSADYHISSAGRSLIEARNAIDYRFVHGKGTIILYSDIKENLNPEDPLGAEEIRSIEKAVRSGEKERTHKLIQQILEDHNIRSVSLAHARFLLYQIISTVFHVIDEQFPNQDIPSNLYPDIMHMVNYETVYELTENILAVIGSLKNAVEEKNSSKSKLTSEKARQYIDSNYRDPQMSLNKISDVLGVSVSYASRIFKKEYGVSILTYISSKRIGRAKELLRNTGCSVREIVEEVGYWDMSSFVRKFKDSTGLTPGEYRKRNRS